MAGFTASLGIIVFLAFIFCITIRLSIKRIEKLGPDFQNNLTATI